MAGVPMRKLILALLICLISGQASATVYLSDNFDGYADSPENHGWGLPDTFSVVSSDSPDGGRAIMATVLTDGTIKLSVGNGPDVYTSTELSNDTTYHIWVAYTAGSIGNGSVSLYAGTGLTRPASPLATATNAAAVGDAIQFRIYTGGVTATVDQILVDGSSFSEVCE
jgi:hypothetical protein